jgi:hypothetical protein
MLVARSGDKSTLLLSVGQTPNGKVKTLLVAHTETQANILQFGVTGSGPRSARIRVLEIVSKIDLLNLQRSKEGVHLPAQNGWV